MDHLDVLSSMSLDKRNVDFGYYLDCDLLDKDLYVGPRNAPAGPMP